jgi:3-hydroxyisobutyrate dehydrogenase
MEHAPKPIVGVDRRQYPNVVPSAQKLLCEGLDVSKHASRVRVGIGRNQSYAHCFIVAKAVAGLGRKETQMRVAVLGTGIMGGPIARNVAKAGHQVVVWNRTPEKARAIEGAQAVTDPAEAVRGADVVLTMLTDADAVRGVMGQDVLEAFGDEAVWLQTSTVGIKGIEELAALAREANVTMVDSPVLGTKEPAEKGRLTVLASGPRGARERADTIFGAIAQKTFWLGDEPGAGTRMKLVMNNWVVGLTELLAETLALARLLGSDPKKVLEILEGSPMGSPYAALKGKMMLSQSFEPSFPLRHALKDARLVLEAAGADLDLPITRAVAEQMAKAAELGHADEDMAATYYASIERGGDAA